MIELLARLPISRRLALIVVAALVIIVSVMVLDSLHLRDALMQEKQVKTRHVVETAHGLLEHFHGMAAKGMVSEAEAKQRAKQAIAELRYDKEEYFWINDMAPTMIMHPIKPALDGKPLGDLKDPTGKRLFSEMVTTVERSGAGFVDYMWPKPGLEKPVPKISYVKGFKPWDWIIGSGVYVDDIDAAFQQELMKSGVTLIVLIGVLIGISVLLARSITVPLNKAVAAMHDVAKGQGDLTKRLREVGGDEISILSCEFNAFVEMLREMLLKVAHSTEALAQSAAEVSHITTETGRAVVRQQSETDQVATAATEMSSTAQSVAESASIAASSANDAANQASESRKVVAQNRTAISNLSTAVEEAAQLIRRVESDSDNIGSILDTIRGIADQTNLLALNAAIEAARAGEQGRGFAVVADEVRTLAKRTSDATGEIEQMIVTLQEGARSAASAMETGKEQATSSVESAQETQDSLESIINAITNINDMNAHIASAAEEQAAVVEDINRNIVNISGIANENAEGARQAEDAMSNMGEQVNVLRELLSGFKLGTHRDSAFDFSAARTAHLAWMSRIRGHLDGTHPLKEEEVVSHKHCALGKWYYGEGLANYGDSPSMQAIEQPHAELHRTIKECVDLTNRGNTEEAEKRFNHLEPLSKEIVGLLHKVEDEIKE